MALRRIRRYSGPILVVAAVAVTLLWLGQQDDGGDDGGQRAETVATATAETGDLEQIIRLSGTTSAVEYATVTAPRMRTAMRGVTLYNLRESGEIVRQGDVLAEIDSRSIEDRLDDVRSNYTTSVANIRKRKAELRIDLENRKQDLLVAKADRDKWEAEASAAEIRTIVDRELLKIGIEESGAAYEQKQKDLRFTNVANAADLRITEITSERQQLTLSRYQQDLERCKIVAPIDGMAVRQQVFRNGEYAIAREGDQIRPGMIFLKVMDLSRMEIEAPANQAESSLIRVGQKVRVGLDAYPELVLNGRVHSLGALAVGSSGRNEHVRSLPVKIRIDAADNKVNPDMSAYADIIIGGVSDRVIVPRTAVFEDAGEMVVFVARDGEFERRPVVVAMSNHIHTALDSGLAAGERVALARPE